MDQLRYAPHDGLTPRWRGVLHLGAVWVALLAGVALVIAAPNARAAWAGGVFAGSLVLLFGVSASLHRVPWRPRAREWMRRADHAAIFVLIAGTYTPFALLGMTDGLGTKLLLIGWGGAVVGVLPSLFWEGAPRAVVAILCVLLGWAGAVFWMDPRNTLGLDTFLLLLGGGAFYTAGALFYAREWPKLSPKHFSYHELFHACTLVAAALHFVAVWLVVRRG